MMDKIQIVNWLLTRRCNLKCSYCRIVKDYKSKPGIYPNMKYYSDNEMSTMDVINGLKKLKKHNPDSFHIFYGGEPTLREDLAQIINYCNDNDIYYTIISNNTNESKRLMTKLLNDVSEIRGFSASVDPVIFTPERRNTHIYQKSWNGLEKLTEYSKIIKDVVAEITVTNSNLRYLYPLVKELTKRGINSSITFIDISRSFYYDFSNIIDKNILVNKTKLLKDTFDKIIEDNLNVHMKETLLPMIYEHLPSNYDCKIEKNFHNLCVDADGTIRLCLRIKGNAVPFHFNINNLLNDDGILNENLTQWVNYDKTRYCHKCNWTCPMMSEMISNNQDNSKNLVHLDARDKK